jgi:hypothetical protein
MSRYPSSPHLRMRSRSRFASLCLPMLLAGCHEQIEGTGPDRAPDDEARAGSPADPSTQADEMSAYDASLEAAAHDASMAAPDHRPEPAVLPRPEAGLPQPEADAAAAPCNEPCPILAPLDAGDRAPTPPDAGILPLGMDATSPTECRTEHARCLALDETSAGATRCALAARSCGFDPSAQGNATCAALFAACFATHPFDFDLCIGEADACERATQRP